MDVKDFNDDNGTKKILLVQEQAGNAGINLQDVTGKYQRVMMSLSLPTRPTYALQMEGRIYRTGSVTDAIFRYLTTGFETEKSLFINTIANNTSSAENLALGYKARRLRDSFVSLYGETDGDQWKTRLPGAKGEGTGGKEMDRKIADEHADEWEEAKKAYEATRKHNSRNKAEEGVDYYPTPEPVGLYMTKIAHLEPGMTVLEPSAGHGAISRWVPSSNNLTIIEPSEQLLNQARITAQANTTAINGTFESVSDRTKFDRILMNPPYGRNGVTALEHLKKAFTMLKPGGRMVAIVPNGPAFDKRFNKWMLGEADAKTGKTAAGQKDLALVSSISLPRIAFAKAGTSVSTKILVLEKVPPMDKDLMEEAKDEAESRNWKEWGFKDIEDQNEFFKALNEDVDNTVLAKFGPEGHFEDFLNTYNERKEKRAKEKEERESQKEEADTTQSLKFSLSSPKFLVTNKNITGDTRVKVVDVTKNDNDINPLASDTKKRVRDLLTGKHFRLSSDGDFIAKNRDDKDHFAVSNDKKFREDPTRKKYWQKMPVFNLF